MAHVYLVIAKCGYWFCKSPDEADGADGAGGAAGAAVLELSLEVLAAVVDSPDEEGTDAPDLPLSVL